MLYVFNVCCLYFQGTHSRVSADYTNNNRGLLGLRNLGNTVSERSNVEHNIGIETSRLW